MRNLPPRMGLNGCRNKEYAKIKRHLLNPMLSFYTDHFVFHDDMSLMYII